jgi:hypothetical protein
MMLTINNSRTSLGRIKKTSTTTSEGLSAAVNISTDVITSDVNVQTRDPAVHSRWSILSVNGITQVGNANFIQRQKNRTV